MLAIPPDVEFEPFGKCVDHRRADPVQTAGRLIGAFAELAARVWHFEQHGGRGQLFSSIRQVVERHAAAFVANAHDSVEVDLYQDLRAKARYGFIDSVIEGFTNEVNKATRAGQADV